MAEGLQLPVGQVPDEWKVLPLKDVTSKIGSGSTPRGGASVYVEAGMSFIRSQNVLDHGFSSDGLVRINDEAAYSLRGVEVLEGDVLINITGDSILRTCIVPNEVLPARVSQHVAILRSNGLIEPQVLQKWLSLEVMKDFMLGHSSGGTRKAVTKGDLERFPVPVPPLAEQQAIADVLGALDDKIESNRRQHSLIEQTVEATFQNICANSSGEYQAMGNIVEQGVSGVWGSDTQQSESEVCVTCLRGVDLHDLASGVIPNAPLRWVSSGQSASRVPQEGEIWVEASGFRCGRSVVIGSHTNVLFAQPVRNSNFVKRLVPKISVRDSYVAWLALKKVYASEEINNFRTGTSIRNLDVEGMLKNVRVPILDNAQSLQLEGLLECLLSPSRAKETSSLESLRDTLLPELLSGRLRIKDAESMMETV